MADRQKNKMLEALSLRAKDTIEYFDFVTIRIDNDGGVWSYGTNAATGPTIRRAYLCVGKKALVLMRTNLQRLAKGGVVEYTWIDKVIEDTRTPTEFALSMNSQRSSDCPAYFVCSSQNRATLLTKMSISFLADTMLRLGKVEVFPRFEAELNTPATCARVLPFKRYKQAALQDYYFYIREEFEEAASTSGVKTGVYKAPVSAILGSTSSSRLDREAELEVQLHIYNPVALSDLGYMAREHVRWLAMEYKQALLRTQQTYVLRNKLYVKKMNLSNDVAAWVGWELFLQDSQNMTVVILLRRQYVPPLVDTAQDFALLLKCPSTCGGERRTKDFQEDLIHEAHVMADSLTSQADNPVLCTDIIQAKLDALLYDEEAYGWIRSRLKLRPEGASQLEKYGSIFTKGILKILKDENALEHPTLYDEAAKRVAAVCEKKSEQDLDPLIIANQRLLIPAEGIQSGDIGQPDDRTKRILNSWRERVARYLAYCCDGGLFGAKFTLTDIITNLVRDKVSQTSGRKLAQVLAFLIHLRPKDLLLPWEPKTLTNQLVAIGMVDPGSGDQQQQMVECTFNDRVMQAMVETGYLKKLLPGTEKDGEMSPKYACLLHYLLQSDQASVNLKAATCRQIIAKKDSSHPSILSVGLVHVLRHGGLFLATYATAALVNLSVDEFVKNYVMHDGVEIVILDQLESKDDDLTLYTLMLLVHCTKSIGHRATLVQRGILDKLYKILSANYAVLHYKRRVLTELCSVLGQLCNDEETRHTICENYQYVIDCLLQIFETAELLPGDRKAGETLPSTSTKIISKVLFALKQLCAHSSENKDLVGNRVIKFVVKDLQNPNNLEFKDWATNAILLLLLLAISHTNCHLINDAGWQDTFVVLSSSPLGKLDATRDRISQIDYRVDTLVQAGA